MESSDSDVTSSTHDLTDDEESSDGPDERWSNDEDALDPTLFEPLARDAPAMEPEVTPESGNEGLDQRLEDLSWCQCSHCEMMQTGRECLCCKEIGIIDDLMAEFPGLTCITDHPGFTPLCTDVWVLETCYYAYRQQYGSDIMGNHSTQEKLRHTAYRNFARWVWGIIGRKQRKILPACVVAKIRSSFTSDHYTGFKGFRY